MFNLLFLAILAIPSIVLFFRYPQKIEIALQFLITAGLLFFGWKIFRLGSCLRFIGLILFILGILGYYFLIIKPLLEGELVLLRIF